MIKFYEFAIEIAKRMEENTTGYTFSVQAYQILNVEGFGISITKKHCNVSPRLYLGDSYEAYIAGNLDINKYVSDLIKQLPEMFDKPPVTEICNNIFDYNWVKERLCIALSSAKKNWRLLGEIPHTIVEDLMLTVHVFLGFDEGVERTARNIMVRNEMLDKWGIDKKTLFEDAMKSSPTVNPINTFSLFGPMICVTCRNVLVGSAAGIFYPGVFEQIAEKMNGSYYILPSSVFEVIVVPDDENFDPETLSAMVVEVNKEEVKDSEVLSDHAYYYDVKEKKFRSV